MAMQPDVDRVAFSLEQGSLAERLASLLSALQKGAPEAGFTLDDLSLRLGLRLPDLAQTATYWHRADVGRTLRGLGFGVRVEFGRVIFVRTGRR